MSNVPHYTPRILKVTASAFLAAMTLSLTPAVTHAAPVTSPEGEQRYIVKYDNDVNAEAESNSLQQRGIEVKDTLSHTVKASVVVATSNEIESVKRSEDVALVELDTRVSVSGATSIWGLDRIDQRTGRDGQLLIGNEGTGVDVYVVDTGLNFSHTEFSGRITDRWWGVHDGREANDCSGHGTHVAGSAVGTTYGVAKKANLIPVRALDCAGNGWSSTIMSGIDWAVSRHVAGQPAVMNLSIGGFTNSSFDQTVQAAVNDGITVIAAAGNDGLDACNASPARVQSAITVAATDINDAQISWSNYGSCVDIQAPGVSIRSAWINAPTGYNTMSGTSMAAPHVAGAAAVMLSRDRSMSPSQVHQTMINNATTGVVSSNKGATPNRFLFLPGTPPVPPSCSNLQLGSAWAGVGTHCGLGGSAASALGSAESAPASAPAVEPIAATAPSETSSDGAVSLPLIKEDMPVTAPAAAEIPAEVVAPEQKAPDQKHSVSTEVSSQAPASTVTQVEPSAPANTEREIPATELVNLTPENVKTEVEEAQSVVLRAQLPAASGPLPMNALPESEVITVTPMSGISAEASKRPATTGESEHSASTGIGAILGLVFIATLTYVIRIRRGLSSPNVV